MKQIIKKPVVSEKSFTQSGNGKYSFIADAKTDKIEARDSIEKIFNVSVEKINIIKQLGKIKRVKGKLGKRNDYKKVIVTLKKGQKIALFEADKEDKKAEAKSEKGVETKIRTKTKEKKTDK